MIFTDQPRSPGGDKLSMTFTQKMPNRRVYVFCRCQMQFDESWNILSPQSCTKTLISPSSPPAAVLGVIMLPGSGLGFRFKSELRSPPGMLVFTPDNLQASTGPISLAGVEPIERVKEDWQSCCRVHTETCLCNPNNHFVRIQNARLHSLSWFQQSVPCIKDEKSMGLPKGQTCRIWIPWINDQWWALLLISTACEGRRKQLTLENHSQGSRIRNIGPSM